MKTRHPSIVTADEELVQLSTKVEQLSECKKKIADLKIGRKK